jgi:hypothetical protein
MNTSATFFAIQVSLSPVAACRCHTEKSEQRSTAVMIPGREEGICDFYCRGAKLFALQMRSRTTA